MTICWFRQCSSIVPLHQSASADRPGGPIQKLPGPSGPGWLHYPQMRAPNWRRSRQFGGPLVARRNL